MSILTREPLSGADSAWWRMDAPANPMVITAVLIFDAPMAYERLANAVRHRLLSQPRFRQRVVGGGSRWRQPYWEEVPTLSLDHHLTRLTLPAPRDEAALQHAVGTLMSTALDRSRPPWRFHLVEEYHGGSVVIARIHHAVADGLALLEVLLSLDDLPSDSAALLPVSGMRVARPEQRRMPALGVAVRSAGVIARLVFGRSDARSRLRGQLGREKRAAWSRPFPLASIREAGHREGGTVHDVVAAVVAGALRGCLGGRGPIRAVVPVNLRTAAERGTLGNRFGLVFLPLPVGQASPHARRSAVRRAMAGLKRSPEAGLIYLMLRVFGRMGDPFLAIAVRVLARRSSLVLTDVPGPREPIRICGARLASLMAWVPQSGPVGLGVSVLSYAGQVRFGVAADARIAGAPAALVAGIERELDALLRAGSHAPASTRSAWAKSGG